MNKKALKLKNIKPRFNSIIYSSFRRSIGSNLHSSLHRSLKRSLLLSLKSSIYVNLDRSIGRVSWNLYLSINERLSNNEKEKHEKENSEA